MDELEVGDLRVRTTMIVSRYRGPIFGCGLNSSRRIATSTIATPILRGYVCLKAITFVAVVAQQKLAVVVVHQRLPKRYRCPALTFPYRPCLASPNKYILGL